MTQNEKVLAMLRQAGRNGICSREFFACGMPRGAARIRDLRDQGVGIESVREGKYTRYRLAGVGVVPGPGQAVVRGGVHSSDQLTGSSADGSSTRVGSPPRGSGMSAASVASSESEALEAVGSRGLMSTPSAKASGVTPRSVPSMFDVDADWSAA
jgi:hypothetical protein